MSEHEQQLSFDEILRVKKIKAKSADTKVKKASAKRVRKAPKKPIYEVSLTHERGVDWRLDCFQLNGEELDAAYYDHIAREALKLELLKILKQDKPEEKEVHMLSLVLTNLGVDLPDYLKIDPNKNLLEYDYWCDFVKADSKRFTHRCSSYLWAFYFTDFRIDQRIAKRSFTEYPAEETDMSFLVDHEIAGANYPGISSLVG